MDIVDFLSERLDEDEAAARKLPGDRSVYEAGQWYEPRLLLESARQTALATMVHHTLGDDPQWVPESIEWTTKSLNALALPYSDHPDFDPEWLAGP